MAKQDNPEIYRPGCTLGRSGYQQGAEDRLYARVEQLDALLCLVTVCESGDEPEGFWSLNNDIQRAVLNLAAQLAEDAHEAQAELIARGVSAIRAKQQAAPTGANPH